MKDNLETLLNLQNVTTNSADLYIYGNIVSSWWGAWEDTDQYPSKIRNFLNTAKGKDLNIYINSGGGSVFAGMAIYQMIKRHDGKTTTYIDGIAGSIASVIALASDRVVMPSNASFFVHKPLVPRIGGNADDLRKCADQLDILQEAIVNIYSENLADGATREDIEALVNKETYISASDTSKIFKIELSQEKKEIEYVASMFENVENLPDFIQEKINNTMELKKAQSQLNLLKLMEVTIND